MQPPTPDLRSQTPTLSEHLTSIPQQPGTHISLPTSIFSRGHQSMISTEGRPGLCRSGPRPYLHYPCVLEPDPPVKPFPVVPSSSPFKYRPCSSHFNCDSDGISLPPLASYDSNFDSAVDHGSDTFGFDTASVSSHGSISSHCSDAPDSCPSLSVSSNSESSISLCSPVDTEDYPSTSKLSTALASSHQPFLMSPRRIQQQQLIFLGAEQSQKC